MTSSESKHQKHSKLNKPSYGEYHRNEFAFVGAPCGDIQSMVSRISVHMSQKRLAYIDADHKSADEASNPDYNTWSSLTDKITFRSFQSFSEYNKFVERFQAMKAKMDEVTKNIISEMSLIRKMNREFTAK